ncbi:MAG: SDR family NAD(P)-dependent oxidoreductase [Gammaproteobacteria bacterium]
MDLQLSGKRALVTGSNSGIGAGIARTLGAEGARVVIHGRDAARSDAVAAEIRGAGGIAHVALGDLATEPGCTAVGDAALAALGGIDILVNNAGGRACSHRSDGQAGPLNAPWLEIPWSDWAWTYEQNVGAAVRLIQRFVPGMKERGWGRVINISSSSATQTEPDLADYQAAKAAMVNMTSSLARTLAHTGITVNTVSPGIILTPAVVRTFTDMARQLGWNAGDWAEIERRFVNELIPIAADHFGETGDIARMVALLASPLSGYMTGANYRVDGGQCRSVN